MNLTVNEAASLLGVSPRTVRARLARGDLAGEQREGRWYLSRRDLHPPGAAAKARAVQETVERALVEVEPNGASAAACAPIRGLLPLILEMDGPAAEDLEEALRWLTIGWHEYRPEAALIALTHARASLATAVARLLLASARGDAVATRRYRAIETDVLRPLIGMFRGAERRQQGGGWDR